MCKGLTHEPETEPEAVAKGDVRELENDTILPSMLHLLEERRRRNPPVWFIFPAHRIEGPKKPTTTMVEKF